LERELREKRKETPPREKEQQHDKNGGHHHHRHHHHHHQHHQRSSPKRGESAEMETARTTRHNGKAASKEIPQSPPASANSSNGTPVTPTTRSDGAVSPILPATSPGKTSAAKPKAASVPNKEPHKKPHPKAQRRDTDRPRLMVPPNSEIEVPKVASVREISEKFNTMPTQLSPRSNPKIPEFSADPSKARSPSVKTENVDPNSGRQASTRVQQMAAKFSGPVD